MSQEYLSHYEQLCLVATPTEIKQAYPRLSIKQIKLDIELMKAMNTEWERAKFRRFLRKIRHLIYR